MLNYRYYIICEGLLLIFFSIMMKKWLLLKYIPISRLECKKIPYLWPKQPKNHTLWGCAYLYSPSKGVPPPPGWSVSGLAILDHIHAAWFRSSQRNASRKMCLSDSISLSEADIYKSRHGELSVVFVKKSGVEKCCPLTWRRGPTVVMRILCFHVTPCIF